MCDYLFDWDDINDFDGNYRHILDACIDPRDVEAIILKYDSARQPTHYSFMYEEPRYIVSGTTTQGEPVTVIYERGKEKPHVIRPVTAWYQD